MEDWNVRDSQQDAMMTDSSDSCAETLYDNEAAPIRVLCFDGGGFRGKASLLILDTIMRAISAKVGAPVKPSEYFDIIAGTSAGALIALMLGRLGYTTDEAITKYNECSTRIFGKVNSNKAWVAAGYPKVDPGPLEELLKEIGRAGGNEDGLLADDVALLTSRVHCRCFVTVVAANAPGGAPILLRSYPSSVTGIPFGHKWKIWEAARATSAAPVYFEPFVLKPKNLSSDSKAARSAQFRFSDAGVAGCNNPSIEVMNEIANIPELAKRPIGCFVSIGTGLSGMFQLPPKLHHRPRGPLSNVASVFKGFLHVAEAPQRLEGLIKYFTTVATDTQKTAKDVYHKLEDKGCLDAYFRFDPPRGLGDFDLADISRGADIEVATHEYTQLPAVGKEIQNCINKLLSAAICQLR